MMFYGYLSVRKDFRINKNNHNQKHLTLSDRVYIEQELLQGSTFRSIANTLHKDPSTISKEAFTATYLSIISIISAGVTIKSLIG